MSRPNYVKVPLTIIAVPLELLALLALIAAVVNRDWRQLVVCIVATLIGNVLLMIAWGGEERPSRYDDY